MQIHVSRAGQRSGPHSVEEVQSRLEACALSPTDLAWYEGVKDWIPLSQVPGLKMPERVTPPRLNGPPPLRASAPPPLHSAAPAQVHSTTPRRGLMIACGVGGIILALVMLGAAANFLGAHSDSGLPLLGVLLIFVQASAFFSLVWFSPIIFIGTGRLDCFWFVLFLCWRSTV